MTYISKTVSCKSIIAKVFRTLRPVDSDWVNSAIEDMGWAIQAIGYHTNFVDKETAANDPVEIVGHRALIPCDIERIKYVKRYILDTETINILNPDGTTPQNIVDINNDCSNLKTIRLRLGSDDTGYALSVDNYRTTKIQPGDVNYYQINGNYIVTGFETGKIQIGYKGFNIDEGGLPLIVDAFHYKEAVFWYIVKNMLLRGYRNPELTYALADANFKLEVVQAQNEVKMPSIDGLERFAAGWLRYSQGREFYKNFFMNMEQPELTSL